MEIQEKGCYIIFPHCAYKKLQSCLSKNNDIMVPYSVSDRINFHEIGQGAVTHTI